MSYFDDVVADVQHGEAELPFYLLPRPGETSHYHSTHMNTTKRLSDLSPRTMLRLSEIERLIRKEQLIVPTPSRRTLIRLCDEGIFEAAPRRRLRDPYLVTEESFLKWVASLSGKG